MMTTNTKRDLNDNSKIADSNKSEESSTEVHESRSMTLVLEALSLSRVLARSCSHPDDSSSKARTHTHTHLDQNSQTKTFQVPKA